MARRKVVENQEEINLVEPNWDDRRKEWEDKVEQMEQRARRIDVLKDIYEKVFTAMQWDAMEYHSSDEEHSETWFTVPREDYYTAWKYPIYLEVLEKISEMANE